MTPFIPEREDALDPYTHDRLDAEHTRRARDQQREDRATDHAAHPDFANNTFTPPPPFTPLNLRSTQDAKLVAAAQWIYNHPDDEDGVKRSAGYILEQLIGDAA